MREREGKPTMTELLREALMERRESLRSIARAAGVHHPSLVRFLAGKSLRLDIADKLAAYLGVECRRTRGRRRKEGS
jgi:plasmid maintenance system antidote protein VapI